MANKTIQIEIPVGWEIDKEKSTVFNIQLKPENDEVPKIKTWNHLLGIVMPQYSCYIAENGTIFTAAREFIKEDRNVFINKKYAKASLAISQISQLLPYYGGAITNQEWCDKNINKYCITRVGINIIIDDYTQMYYFLSFHTQKQAEDFLVNNKQLVYDYLMLDMNE